jgi:hypothetical protein
MSSPRYVLELEIAGLPRMSNSSGRSTNRFVLKRERDLWKKLIWASVAGRLPAAPLKRARLTLTRLSSSEPDFDGLVSGFKFVVDGLVLAGVLANDKASNIGQPQYRWEKAPPKGGRIRIRVEELLEGEAHGN